MLKSSFPPLFFEKKKKEKKRGNWVDELYKVVDLMIVKLLLFLLIGRFTFNKLLMRLLGNNLLRGSFTLQPSLKLILIRILQVRTMLYELLTHCIPPTTIIKVGFSLSSFKGVDFV